LDKEYATPMALLLYRSPHDSVGVVRQHCPINNETAMRFLFGLSMKSVHTMNINNEIAMRFLFGLSTKSGIRRT